MIKKRKRGFTIVELVIVIAIIGVLSAILIPTFAGLVNSAKEAADSQMVKNLNTALASDAATNGKHETAYDAIKVANETGYSVEKLTPTSFGYDIVWDKTTDRFMLISGNEYKYYDQSTTPSKNKYDLWKIYKYEDIPAEDEQSYSIYLTGSDETNPVTIKGVGFDVGENTGISEVQYTGKDGSDVIIRTNALSAKVTIDAPLDTVRHYGICGDVDIVRTADSSYHEYGTAGFVKIASGKIFAEIGGKIITLVLIEKGENATLAASVKLNGGEVKTTYATTSELASANQATLIEVESGKTLDEVIEEKKAESESGLANLMGYQVTVSNGTTTEFATLENVRFNVNNGFNNYSGYTITLLNDIDLENKEWIPIGDSEAHSFAGSFDGNNKTISNLKMVNVYSEGTGFFGYVNNSENSIEFKNVTFKNVSITLGEKKGKNVGTLIGYVLNTNKDITIDNVDVVGSSEVSASQHVGGIVGKIYAQKATIKNCINNANVICYNTGAYCGGIVAIVSTAGQEIEFNNCINNGSVTGGTIGGITGRTGSEVVLIKNCVNNGDILATSRGGGIIGTTDDTVNLTIDELTTVGSGVMIGKNTTSKGFGILIGNAHSNKTLNLTISRASNTEYCDRTDLKLVGQYGKAIITLNNVKAYNFGTVGVGNDCVSTIYLNNCSIDEMILDCGSTGLNRLSFYVDGNNNSSIQTLKLICSNYAKGHILKYKNVTCTNTPVGEYANSELLFDTDTRNTNVVAPWED